MLFDLMGFFLIFTLLYIFLVYGAAQFKGNLVTEKPKEDICSDDSDYSYKRYEDMINSNIKEIYITKEDLESLSNDQIKGYLYLEMNGYIDIILITNAGEKINLSKNNFLDLSYDFKDIDTTKRSLKVDNILSMKKDKLFQIVKTYSNKPKSNISHSKRNREKFDGNNIPHRDICEEEVDQVVEVKKTLKNKNLAKGIIVSEILDYPLSKRNNKK